MKPYIFRVSFIGILVANDIAEGLGWCKCMGYLQMTVTEVIGVFITIALGAFLMFQLFNVIQSGAPAWVNNTINNLTTGLTSTIIPIVLLVIVIVLVMIAWNVWQRSNAGAGAGGSMY